MSPRPDIDALSAAELKSLVLQLLEEVAELRRTVAAQRDEIARLKGGPGRPHIKPSGMDQATEPKPPASGGERRRRGSTRTKLVVHEERTLKAEAPPGSRFKGYAGFLVQDLLIRAQVTHFRRECWQTPDGQTVMAPLPEGIDGHFGPELRRFVLAQYHQGQVTVPRLVALLRGFGILISKRQIVRLLIAGKESFLEEARGVLRAGLQSATWITVDDTGARHQATNGFCTQIGNAQFAWFATTGSKSRLNFLELLRAGMAITSSMPKPWPICAAVRSPHPSSLAWPSMPIAPSPIARPGTRISTGSASRLSPSIPIPCSSPPRALCGAASRRMAFCPTP